MSIVTNVQVSGLKESMIAAGYPMRTKVPQNMDVEWITEKDQARAQRLLKAAENDNEAHSQFLTGITVSFDLTFTVKAWTEAERYRFLSFVSSQSTMHRITKFDLDEAYNEYVDKRIVSIMKEKVNAYNALVADGRASAKEYLEILYSNPCGFKLTARLVTNYRCLRNIYAQRKNHRLPEWQEFCEWVETLPMAKELITGGKGE